MLQINRGFADDLHAGRTACLQVILDGSDSNTAGIALSYAGRITGRYSQAKCCWSASARLRRGASRRRPLDLRSRAWFNENLRKPQLLRPRRDRHRRQPGQPAA